MLLQPYTVHQSPVRDGNLSTRFNPRSGLKTQVEMQLHRDVFHNMGTSENKDVSSVLASVHT